MDQLDVFRKALENPMDVHPDELHSLVSRYPYCQPLIFAGQRKNALEQQPLDKQKALIYAYSPFWLRDYVLKPVDVIPELEVDSDDYVAYEELEVEESVESAVEQVDEADGSEGNRSNKGAPEPRFTETELTDADVTLTSDVAKDESETQESVFDPPLPYNIETAFSDQGDEITDLQSAEELAEEHNEQASQEDISLYNDELMPYSFRWWLYKTRLEHAETYQPFAAAELPKPKAGQFDPKKIDEAILDQQIRENIFHLQDPEDKLSAKRKKKTIEFGTSQPMDEVIDRFIREEPQIQPPKAEEINTENKARQSSEDRLRVVTETLADIYISQGMYERALSVFRKLISENPEKKSYFATRIREIEQKL